MSHLNEIVKYTDTLLKCSDFKDYCPNGLQIEGREQVQRMVSGVTACQALIDKAVQQQADLILVHHGYFWKGENPVLTGHRKQRIKTLLENDISLLAYHLPLDAHPELGNNAGLAQSLGFEVTGPLNAQGIGQVGVLSEPVSAAMLAERVSEQLQRTPTLIEAGDHPVKKVAWCTGAAQNYIEQAIEQGVDLYISGEISEQTVHLARENGVHYLAAGHHATERFGVQLLGEHLSGKFGLDYQFIDIDNPV